jgi:predicted TIM-barrel fold metal-dependent hydrolase
MERMAILSVDGHVKASRAGYRDYIEKAHLADFDEWVKAEEASGMPDSGNLNFAFGIDAQWDSDKRIRELESEGVVGEVLFPNGIPFASFRRDTAASPRSGELLREGRAAYNRWLADFCSAARGRRAGQAVISFNDIDAAVRDIHWAKEHGLSGVMMPALDPGGTFFFDPKLDPVWAACEETGLPISQHGGAGTPRYQPAGFASIICLAMEHTFFSGRSLWQMMLGGVFDRFPKLQVVFVETEADWLAPAMKRLGHFSGMDNSFLGFARATNTGRTMQRSPMEYWESNCHAGLSPFSSSMSPIEDLARTDFGGSEFFISADKAMFGVDYPHYESILLKMKPTLNELLSHPAIDEAMARKVLYENAAHIYGFDLDALAPDMERVGFTKADILASAASGSEEGQTADRRTEKATA